MKQDFDEVIEIPDGIQVTADKEVVVMGPKGELKRSFIYPGIYIKVEGKEIKITSKNATKREKKLIFTYKAHLANMLQGVQEPWVYKLKVCASHFPMNVSVSGKEFIVKNFLGEKVPRKILIKEGVTVKVDGKDVLVESIDKELAGNTASEIELLTVVRGRDLRVFQDGIYITEKAGKPIK
ncbi:50S ribosomal protein L6 [Candidatus Woesearchaeota archaeon]|nr:50S ribosomal protein L6 [Candidatus Woesearchaeota archaeon]MBW3006058.1 50S ribosomal protein L6 [Candidatus Woesearchaeota archaeon]